MSEGSMSGEIPQPLQAETSEKPQKVNPWGSVAPSVMRAPVVDRRPETKAHKDHMQRQKEVKELTEAAFAVTIDRSKLASVQILERKRGYGETEDAETAAARTELEAVMETMRRLPEDLTFQPGITLLVGENGSGKSTLAKALYLAARVKDSEELLFDRGPDDARRLVFNPSRGDVGQTAFLAQAGLAPQIGEAMTVDSFACGREPLRYRDVPEIIGSQHSNDMEMFARNMFAGYDETGRRMDTSNHTGLGDYRSHRQTVDQMFDGLKGRQNTPQVLFIDEPETGMSPRRHMKIKDALEGYIPQGSIAIMPTNSVVLFESDLPRIDLEFPERGIHRPSEYSENQAVGVVAGATTGAEVSGAAAGV